MVVIYISTISPVFNKQQFIFPFIFHMSEFLLKTLFKCILCAYVWVHICGGHRASFRSHFIPSNMCSLGIELRLSSLMAGGEHSTYDLSKDLYSLYATSFYRVIMLKARKPHIFDFCQVWHEINPLGGGFNDTMVPKTQHQPLKTWSTRGGRWNSLVELTLRVSKTQHRQKGIQAKPRGTIHLEKWSWASKDKSSQFEGQSIRKKKRGHQRAVAEENEEYVLSATGKAQYF